MQAYFLLTIDNPESHYLQVRLTLKGNLKNTHHLFLPVWSPGSYFLREYSSKVRKIKITDNKGVDVVWSQSKKNEWEISDLSTSELNISYEIYCHDLTCRTSHINEQHAFLHGPSFYMGIKDVKFNNIEVDIRFPATWSKISTGLKSISNKREEFKYTADNYDQLLDCPIEIGCHHTDGFLVEGVEHEIALWGDSDRDLNEFKFHIKTLVETVLKTTKEIPYKRYVFIIHLAPNLYGGLEHLNSTVVQFCSLSMNNHNKYQDWLSLIAHEYFHTWNVKRIRPIELGPFNYYEENYTRMHWLTEGLTSFVDELFTLRSGLITLEDYLRMQKRNLSRYFSNRGKLFDSLEESSFNAWIKLYRPDENSINSSISYYLKGGIAFWILNTYLFSNGNDIDDVISELWSRYKKNQNLGVTKNEVFNIIKNFIKNDDLEKFSKMIETTEDLPLIKAFEDVGLKLLFEKEKLDLGWILENRNGRAFIKSVYLDGSAFKSKLNAGDEILAINNKRVLFTNCEKLEEYVIGNKNYDLTISRNGTILNIDLVVLKGEQELKDIAIVNVDKAKKFFRVSDAL